MDSRCNSFPVFLIIFFGLITSGSFQDCTHLCSSCHDRDTRPMFCDKGFELESRNGIHKLEKEGITYRVWHIDEKACTMLLTLDDHSDLDCSDLQERVNTTLSTALFKYVHDVRNLTYPYQCNTIEPPPNNISCPTNVFYKTENKEPVQVFLNGTVPCEGNVQVPVVLFIVKDWPSLEETLRRGLWVQYLVEGKEGINWRVKIAIGLGTGFGSIIAMLVLFYFYLRRKKRKDAAYLLSRNISSDPSSRVVDVEKSNRLGVHLFSYFELEEATNKFDSAKELGDGGFGTVYYGKLRDGRAVAVKRLYEHNFKRVEQFLNEVEILTRLRHKNLVSLYGCTSRHSRELLLVYEYVSNGTIADHLHGDRAKPGSLPLCTRLKIAVETASALSYLHASDIIHRDVKTNNILLDEHFCVKVADFGLSRLFPTDVTHVSTAPQGTPGYVDPDYHQCYQLTDKSDVYSFGVVLIELISSMPAVDITRHRHEINLSNLAIGKIQGKAVHELVDPALGYGVDGRARRAVEAVAELAFGCLQGEKDLRPPMVEVLEALRRIQSEMCDTDEVVLSPGSAGMGWSSSNDTTPNATL